MLFDTFTRKRWLSTPLAKQPAAELAIDPATLSALAGVNVELAPEEAVAVHLPIARLIDVHLRSNRAQHLRMAQLLAMDKPPVQCDQSERGKQGESVVRPIPFLIGLAGSVAVGKSTLARMLCYLLRQMQPELRVEIVTTDGFLLPNAELQSRQIMHRKGFPESYDLARLLGFVTDLKSGVHTIDIPVYSHQHYDVVPGRSQSIVAPDVVLIEGLNVLQPPPPGRSLAVADLFDFSMFVDADTLLIERWFLDRLEALRKRAHQGPANSDHSPDHRSDHPSADRLRQFDAEALRARALQVWRQVNLVNLELNILPTKPRADLILRKGEHHQAQSILIRRALAESVASGENDSPRALC